MENRTIIFSTSKEHKALIIKDLLEAEGINTLILNHPDSISETFGCVEVYVQTEDVEKAKSIVEKSRE
jgi:hypothetical protein